MHEAVEIAVKHAVDVALVELRADVFHQAVRRQHIVADLAAEVDVGLRSLELVAFYLLLLHLVVIDSRFEHLHRRGAVLVLGALVLALHDDARGMVRHTHRGVGPIDVLAAGAAGAVGVDAKVVGLDVDLDLFVDLGIDEDGGEGGVPARVGVERRDAHQPMHADFRAQQPVGILALDGKRSRLETGFLTRQAIGDLRLEAVPLDPTQVHA